MTTFDFAGAVPLRTVPLRTVPLHGASLLERTARPIAPRRRDISLVQLRDDLWRVTRLDGDVLGYVESFVEPRGHRFRSKRLIALHKTFVALGEFWSFDDAVDCLRFG